MRPVPDTVRGMYVEPERWLTVRPGRHEVVLAAGAEQQGAEADHDVATLVLKRHRRHGHEDVVGQHGHEGVEVAGLVGADELRHERSLSG